MQHATEQRNFGALTYKIKYKWKKADQESRTEVGRRAKTAPYVRLKVYEQHG